MKRETAFRYLAENRREARLEALPPVYVHRVNKNGKPAKKGTKFGSEPWHAETPEAEVARLEELNPGTQFVVIRK